MPSEDDKPKILMRGACLSRLVFECLDCTRYQIVNCERQRADFALELKNSSGILCDYDELSAYCSPARDRTPAFVFGPQRSSMFGHRNVRLIVIDSFSEVVNVKFSNRRNPKQWFSATFSDIRRDGDFFEKYESRGRLDLTDVRELYRLFLDALAEAYPGVPILYIPFPDQYDFRAEYKERHRLVREAIESLAPSYPGLRICTADLVERHPFDADIYHFSAQTYRRLAEKIVALGFGLRMRPEPFRILKLFFRKLHSYGGMRRIVLLSCLAITYWSPRSGRVRLPRLLSISIGKYRERRNWV